LFGIAFSFFRSLVGIFSATTNNNYYNSQNYLGSGFVLTSDGWLITTNDIITSSGNYVALTHSGEILQIQEIYFENNLGIVYLKTKANNLSVVSFKDFSDVFLGEKVIILSGLEYLNQNIGINYLSSKTFQISDKLIRDSEDRYLYFTLDQALKNDFIGGVAIDFNKNLIGLITKYNSQTYLIPADYIKNSFKKLLDNKKLTSAYLGIEYINLSQNINNNLGQMGVLIKNIKKNSPLYNKIKVDDILIQINDQVINGNKNLTNVVQEYKTGDILQITLIDNKTQEEKKVEVKLK